MSRCTETCLRPTPAQAHCSQCHEHFGGVRAFDRHRSFGMCLHPDEIRYGENEPHYVKVDGIWRQPMDHEAVALFNERVGGKRGRKKNMD